MSAIIKTRVFLDWLCWNLFTQLLPVSCFTQLCRPCGFSMTDPQILFFVACILTSFIKNQQITVGVSLKKIHFKKAFSNTRRLVWKVINFVCNFWLKVSSSYFHFLFFFFFLWVSSCIFFTKTSLTGRVWKKIRRLLFNRKED